jgi:hypothetical protein
MSVEVVHQILSASYETTAMVGERISPVMKSQGTPMPAITLQRINTAPVNGLDRYCNLDANSVQVTIWAGTYYEATVLAQNARMAIEAAGHACDFETDNYDPATEPGLYSIVQQYSIWVTPP